MVQFLVGFLSLLLIFDLTRTRIVTGARLPAKTWMLQAGKSCPTGAPVEKHGIFEESFEYPTSGVRNPWEEITLQASLTAPSGKTYQLWGFYYEPDTYRLRFNPVEIGAYAYSVSLTGPSGTHQYEVNCSFTVVPASPDNRYAKEGFVRQHPTQPHRFIFEEGKFFNGIGLNDCWTKDPPREKPGLGPLYGFTDAGVMVDIQRYMQTYANGGFNLFRWDPGNCSFDVTQRIQPTGNLYLEEEGKLGDLLLATAKQNGFHTLLTIFGNDVPFPVLGNQPEEAAVKRAIDYYVARFGPYVDMWEWTNETCWDYDTNPGCLPSDEWLQYYTNYLKSIDPYQRLVTNSLPRANDWAYLDFRSPHTYLENAYEIERGSTNNFTTNTPVLIGEGYNANFDTHKNYGANNAQITRRAAWTAVISGLGLIWWNTSYSKECECINQYLGSEERTYVGLEHRLTSPVDPQARFQVIAATPDSGNDRVQAYGLLSPTLTLIYITKYPGFFTPVTPTISFRSTFSGSGQWIDPRTGRVLGEVDVTPGPQSLTAPYITEDIVFRAVSSNTNLGNGPAQPPTSSANIPPPIHTHKPKR